MRTCATFMPRTPRCARRRMRGCRVSFCTWPGVPTCVSGAEHEGSQRAREPVVAGVESGVAGRQHRTSRPPPLRSEEHTTELQSRGQLVCRLLLDRKQESFYSMTHM